MDELDRILLADDAPAPRASFSARVMDAVRREVAAPSPIPFPWRRFLPFPAVAAAVLAAWFAYAQPSAAPAPAAPARLTAVWTEAATSVADPAVTRYLPGAFALLLSVAAVQVTLSAAAHRR